MQTEPWVRGSKPMITIYKKTMDGFSGPLISPKTSLTNYQGKWPRVKNKGVKAIQDISH